MVFSPTSCHSGAKASPRLGPIHPKPNPSQTKKSPFRVFVIGPRGRVVSFCRHNDDLFSDLLLPLEQGGDACDEPFHEKVHVAGRRIEVGGARRRAEDFETTTLASQSMCMSVQMAARRNFG